jgi:outer membrane protein assembly factor BamA
LLATLIMFGAPVLAPVGAAFVSSSALAQTVQSISVEGNRRVEVETIRSYFKPGPGGRLDQGAIDDGLKALIETGLFQDVRINRGSGGQIIVSVVENPVIGRIAFKVIRRSRTSSSPLKSSPRRAAPSPAPWCSPTPCESPKSTAARVAMTSASRPRSSSSRTTAST